MIEPVHGRTMEATPLGAQAPLDEVAPSGHPVDLAFIDLEPFRQQGDPLADRAVAEFFAEFEHTDPGSLFASLVRRTKLAPEAMNPALRAYFAEASTFPRWVDQQAVDRGQVFFNRLVAHQFSSLYLASLPNSYAAAKGVQVLRMTGRLQTDTTRRLDETAQLLMDVAAPGALQPGGTGIDRILHVRLMHAAVRWLILHDPSVRRVRDLPPPEHETEEFVWSLSWGVPINQEDLAGTWLTFTAVVYDAFDASGVVYDGREIDDHLHLWRLVAHFLGVDPTLVPQTRVDANVLRRRIFARQQHPSAAGRAMAAALLEQARTRVPKFTWPLMPAAFRHFLGDGVCDMIGLPSNNWTRHLFPAMSALSRVTTRDADRHRLHARFDAFVGRHLMAGMLLAMRSGERAAFSIPTGLAADEVSTRSGHR